MRTRALVVIGAGLAAALAGWPQADAADEAWLADPRERAERSCRALLNADPRQATLIFWEAAIVRPDGSIRPGQLLQLGMPNQTIGVAARGGALDDPAVRARVQAVLAHSYPGEVREAEAADSDVVFAVAPGLSEGFDEERELFSGCTVGLGLMPLGEIDGLNWACSAANPSPSCAVLKIVAAEVAIDPALPAPDRAACAVRGALTAAVGYASTAPLLAEANAAAGHGPSEITPLDLAIRGSVRFFGSGEQISPHEAAEAVQIARESCDAWFAKEGTKR